MSYSEEVEAILAKPTCTVAEAAKILGIGLRQCYHGIKVGEIPSIRIGQRILISTKQLTALLEGDGDG